MAMDLSTPPSSATPLSRRHSPDLSLDLSDLPPLTKPTPPSNTLLVTNLQDPAIFAAPTLQTIQRAINEHAPIHTFAPLKSFRRLIVTFFTTDDAVAIRKVLDGEFVMGNRIKVYFGGPTRLNIEDEERYLHLPKSDKLFFISPPPSPPHGWEMRNEEPPNKEVHAEDLAVALSKLHARSTPDAFSESDNKALDGMDNGMGRQRSGSTTIVFNPRDQGNSAQLPAISVEDTSETHSPDDRSPMEGVEKKFVHTQRPPVELMEH